MNNNKILLISPEFFQYYKYISEELSSQGYEVTHFRDIPGTSTLIRGLSRLNKKLIAPAVSSYLNEIIESVKGKDIDHVFIIYGMTFSFSPEMIQRLRDALPSATFTVYLWDSIKNLPLSEKIIPIFDKAFSFDKNDCNENIQFLPLFYHKGYEKIAEKKGKEKYFCSYVGTAHPQKLKLIDHVSKKLSEKYPNQFIYHYIPSKFKFFYHKLHDTEYKSVKLSDLNLQKISFEQLMDIFSSSLCILDAPQAGQTGLTIRAIEALGAKKKLITANPSIKEYDFYDPANIYIYSIDDEIDFSSDFFKMPHKELPDEIYKKYSLSSWINTILK